MATSKKNVSKKTDEKVIPKKVAAKKAVAKKSVNKAKSEIQIESELVDYLVNNEIIDLIIPGKVKSIKKA